MADEYKELQKAVLNIPFTERDCFSSKEFVDSLVVFKHRISEIIRRLDSKEPKDKFEVNFEINYFKNGVKGHLKEGQDRNTFTLGCYCNGGNG